MKEREHIVHLVRRWGGVSSDALLDSGCSYFQVPNVEGLIAHRPQKGCTVVYGDPVCPPEELSRLTHAFHKFCSENDWNVVYIMASEPFAKWAMDHVCKVKIEFGEELTIDPHQDPREWHGTHASLVRRKVRHAIKEGVEVREYVGADPHLEQDIENVCTAWLNQRKGPQIHISNVHLFADRFGKRWFYAVQRDKVIGVIVLNQLGWRNGWLMNHLIMTPNAPGGTPEILVVNTLETLAKADCHFVTFGCLPSLKLGKIEGLGTFSAFAARSSFQVIRRIFKLRGARDFWEKFHPQGHSSYLLLSTPQLGLRELRGLKAALNITL